MSPGFKLPDKWWQWLLVYSGLAIALIPVVTDYLKSSEGDKQFALWTRNISCVEAPFAGVVNEFNVQTSATICKSGDVLVRFIGPGDKRAYRWVPVELFGLRSAGSFSLIGNAMAQAPRARQREEIICQWTLPNGWVIRRVKINDSCFEEQIWGATGEVKGRRSVDCRAPCR
ncbi:hypothetical protein [Pseudoduganella sp. R-34]|uniref:hypothetical protein n=1 Tax=Pseudoduganella sp. R-34 TaxID=3404062 RepID=UPI003CF9741F